MEAINLYCEIIMSDPFNDCLYTETMKDLKNTVHTALSEDAYFNPPKDCNICKAPITDTFYDAAIRGTGGAWANVCPDCFIKRGMGLGMGLGQKYTKKEDGQFWKEVQRKNPVTENNELQPDEQSYGFVDSSELHSDDYITSGSADEGDPFVTKLDQVLTIMDELKTMSISNSQGWTPKHTEAFQKYLKGFAYYCEQLRDDLTMGD